MQAVPDLDSELDRDGEVPCAEAALRHFVQKHPRLFVLTGAGISRASGIPTYRDEIGVWKSRTPIHHREFIESEASRKRYWARSFAGWEFVDKASPNEAHDALAQLESLGHIQTLVTQNIDRLHQKAGHNRVIDLHGRLDQVICMDCGEITPRAELQIWLREHNSHLVGARAELAPDGDADVQQDLINQVKVPHCRYCGGLLKPNVVFYGSSVNKELVTCILGQLDAADGVLVVGTSLMVYSSFRYCRHASERDIPMACINQGVTRADPLFKLKIRSDCGPALSTLLRSLRDID